MSDHDDNIHTNQTGPLVVILAGGAARRMGGIDKGEVFLSGRRLVDHVVDRISAQAGTIIFSGNNAYGYDWPAIVDRQDGPSGPAAGLWAALVWIKENLPHADGFYTAPIDGPFLPANLLSRLGEHGDSAIAVDDDGQHPTFAYWKRRPLDQALTQCTPGEGVALQRIAQDCGARHALFSSDGSLMNINTSRDLQNAEKRIRSV